MTLYARLRFDLAACGFGFLLHGWQGALGALAAIEAVAFVARAFSILIK